MGRPERRPSSIAVDVALDAVDDHFERDQIFAALEHDEISIFFARLHELLMHGLDRCKILAEHRIEAAAALGNVAADAADEATQTRRRRASEFAEPVCISTNQIYDSCRDRDCVSNARVILPKMTRS